MSVKKLNANEPTEDVSKVDFVNKTIGRLKLIGRDCNGITGILVTGLPAYRRQELYTGVYMEREKLPLR